MKMPKRSTKKRRSRQTRQLLWRRDVRMTICMLDWKQKKVRSSSSSIYFLSRPKLAINQRNENTLTKKKSDEVKRKTIISSLMATRSPSLLHLKKKESYRLARQRERRKKCTASGGYSNLGARGKNFQKLMLSEKKTGLIWACIFFSQNQGVL